MNASPLVTVITPSFNQGAYIEQTILSVLNQTYRNIQYIVIDGGSEDETMDIIKKYEDRIDIVISEKDRGQSDAINKGFRLSRGDLTGWINSDDILYPECVEKIAALYARRPDGSIYYCSVLDKIDGNGDVTGTIRVPVRNRDHLRNRDYTLNQPGSFYKTDILRSVNYIDDSIHYCMDLDLWLRLLERGNIYGLNQRAYSAFRIWPGTKTSTGGEKFLRNIRQVLRKNHSSALSRNILRTYWYSFKLLLRTMLP